VPLLEVGRIVKPHGLRGDVVVELITNREERVAPGTFLRSDDLQLEVVRARPFSATGAGRWIVSFRGIGDLAAAERLRDAVLSAPPIDDPDAFWVHDLIGTTVVDPAGEALGTVTAVQANPASDLLVLSTGALIPLHFVTGREAATVTVDLPAGLLDL
jgi:16S rRNA processing protein RimM